MAFNAGLLDTCPSQPEAGAVRALWEGAGLTLLGVKRNLLDVAGELDGCGRR